jgi:hypothetical protein
MNPDEAARLLREELEDALADLSDRPAKARVLAVETDLPTGLAMAYLADEEAAVDEWKSWVAGLRACLGTRTP